MWSPICKRTASRTRPERSPRSCEPALEESIKIELEHKKLQNALLKRCIELLEKSQAYRCCPVGEAEEACEGE
ncbi:MAG: hypothetical protein P8098_00715 [Candidatus Thiodiazotropha sp.]